MDPQLTDDGKPYGPVRYKDIVKEIYSITKRIHTSYKDVLQMTPTERGYLLEFIATDIKRADVAMEQIKAQNNMR